MIDTYWQPMIAQPTHGRRPPLRAVLGQKSSGVCFTRSAVSRSIRTNLLEDSTGVHRMKIYHGMPSHFVMLLGITFHILSMVTVWYTMVYLFENTKVIYHGFSFSQINQLGIWHVQLNPKNTASRSNLRNRIAQYFQHVGLNKLTGLRPQLIFHIRTL